MSNFEGMLTEMLSPMLIIKAKGRSIKTAKLALHLSLHNDLTEKLNL